MGSEPFLVILGDTVHVASVPVVRHLWDAYEKLRHPVTAVERVRPEKVSDYGIVQEDGWIDERIRPRPGMTVRA